MKRLCELYTILKKPVDHMYILTCNAAVWSRFVRCACNVGHATLVLLLSLLSFFMILWQQKAFPPVVKYIAIKTVDKMAKIATAIMSATSNFENESRHNVLWLSDITLGLSAQTRVVVDWFTDSMPCWSPITSVLTSSQFPLRSRSF